MAWQPEALREAVDVFTGAKGTEGSARPPAIRSLELCSNLLKDNLAGNASGDLVSLLQAYSIPKMMRSEHGSLNIPT